MFNYSEEEMANAWFAYNARQTVQSKKACLLTLVRLEQFAKEDLVVKEIKFEPKEGPVKSCDEEEKKEMTENDDIENVSTTLLGCNKNVSEDFAEKEIVLKPVEEISFPKEVVS